MQATKTISVNKHNICLRFRITVSSIPASELRKTKNAQLFFSRGHC